MTARERSEKLQQVPVSVVAFGAQKIEDEGIRRVDDFIHLTPNMSFVNSQSPGTSFITIRGLTQNRNQPAPVAIVVDGVLQTSDREFAQSILDIASIEVVRGPQGAIYGRNATGGAIIITTQQPTNTTEGYVQAGIGNGGETSVEGSISGPVVDDKLYIRLAGGILDRDGYFENIILHEKADPFHDKKFQGLLKYTPTSKLTVDLHVDLDKTTGGALNLWYQPANLNSNYTLNTANPFNYNNENANEVRDYFYANNIGSSDRPISVVSARVAYDMDFATLTSVTAYTHVSELFTSDQYPYTASRDANVGYLVDGAQSQYVDFDSVSQEIRLTSSSDQRFRWMGGAYFVGTDHFISTTTSEDLGYGIIGLERTPAFNSTTNPTLSFLADNNHDRAYAVFGNVEYDLTKQLEFGAALRYDNDHREQLVSPYNTAGSQNEVNTADFAKLQPKFSLKYQFNDDIQLYTSWGVGFRSGQFNQNGVGAAAATVGLIGVSDVAKAESDTSVEVGFKSQFFDHRLTFDGAYFHTDAQNVQYFVFVAPISAQVLVNINEVKINGGELEAHLELFNGFSADAGLGITDATIASYTLNPADVGKKDPFVPDATGNIGLQYSRPITNTLKVTARVDEVLIGKQYWDPENDTARSSLYLLDARVAVATIAKKWEFSLFGKNLTNKLYNEEYGGGGFAYPANPRTFGGALRYSF